MNDKNAATVPEPVEGQPVEGQPVEGQPVEAPAATRRRFGVLGATVAILFGLLYAYDLWEAINNAIELPKAYEQIAALGVDVGEVPWTLIVVNIAIPPLVYLAALVMGRRRNAFGRAVYFAVGLALVAVLSLDIIALA